MRIFPLKPLHSLRTSQLLIILYNAPVDTKLKLFTATIIEIIYNFKNSIDHNRNYEIFITIYRL